MDTEAIRRARTFLFVPGDRPDRFESALTSGADCVVVDLEDAVAPGAKPAALENVAGLLRGGDWGKPVLVRINDPRTAAGETDVAVLAGIGVGADAPVDLAVMVAKTESVDTLAQLHQRLPEGTALLPLVETATGVLRVSDLAAAAGVVRLAFGHLDLAADLGLDPDDNVRLAPARFALVAASAAAGLPPPVDGVSDDLRDLLSVEADSRESLAAGFTAKLCIHPDQVLTIHRAFAPSQADLEWAGQVIAAAQEGGVGIVAGRMVDRPVLVRARSILARAGAADPAREPGSQ